MTLCAVSLGGNLGDVPGAFAAAVRRLTSTPGISDLRTSRLYRTAPMGASAGEAFHNAACVFETTLLPLDVLDLLQQIETHGGRVRTMHWGPRTLDLDLILYGEDIIQSPPMASAGTPRLIVPHPAMWYRLFVLDPLGELIPDVVHPVFQQTIQELRSRLLVRPFSVCLMDHPVDSLGWVEAVMSEEERFTSLAHPAIHWLPDDASSIETAVLVFASRVFSPPVLRMIRLPDDAGLSLQLMTAVLTAALDDPSAVS